MDYYESLLIWQESVSARGFSQRQIEASPSPQTGTPKLLDKRRVPSSHQCIEYSKSEFDVAWECHHKLDRRSFDTLYHCLLSNFPDTSPVMQLGIDVEVLSRLFRVAIKCGHLVNHGSSQLQRTNAITAPVSEEDPPVETLEPDYTLSQWPCTWGTSQRRAMKIIADMPLVGRRVLFLGDSDFTSISLARRADVKVHVIEQDCRVVKHIADTAVREQLQIAVHQVDLREGLPEPLRERFDAFSCDPIYTSKGIKLFIAAGWEALIKQKGSRAYLSLSHSMFGSKSIEVQRYLAECGFIIEAINPAFNVYPTSATIPEIKTSLGFFEDTALADSFLGLYAPFVYTSLYTLILAEEGGRCPRPCPGNEYDYMFHWGVSVKND